MHYQEQSECQADDAYFKANLLSLLSGSSSFQGSVTYTGGCQPESADRALAGGTCYEPVESSGRRLSELYSDPYYSQYPGSALPSSTPDFYSDSIYSDSQYPGSALPPSSTPDLYSDSIYWDSPYPGFALPPSSTPYPVCGCEEMDVAFCNYDYGNSGFCESCGDVSTSPCDQRGLPDKGVADCEACCNVSHPYPHPRPNCSGS